MAMKGRDYKKGIKALKLSQAKAAVFFGFSTRQSRRIASPNASAELRLADEKLLRVMLQYGLTVEMVDDLLKKPKRAKAAPKKDAAAAPPA